MEGYWEEPEDEEDNEPALSDHECKVSGYFDLSHYEWVQSSCREKKRLLKVYRLMRPVAA